MSETLIPVTVDLTGAARTAARFWGERARRHLAQMHLEDRFGSHVCGTHHAEQARRCAVYAGTAARLAR